ncbi:MAG: DUF2157 domain-containing protein [Candidatus Omnitrophota bacterium]
MNKNSIVWLKKEIDAWEKENLITSRSAEILKERYRAKGGAIEETVNRRRVAATLAILGSVFIGLGTVLFFMDIWRFIPDYFKFIIVVLPMCFFYLAGFYVKFYRGHPKIGGVFMLLGALLFGSALFINNRIFDLGFALKDNLLWWFIFIVPIGYFAYSKKILELALVLMSVWFGLEAVQWINLETKSELYIYLYYFFGILIYALGITHNQIKKLNVYKGPFQIIGGILLLCAIYLLTFFDTIPDGFFLKLDITRDLKNILIIAGAALLFLLIEIGFKKKRQHILSVQVYTLIMALIAGLLSLFGLFGGMDALIFNILFLALMIGLVIIGVNTKEISLINLGIIFFIIDIISRFFDIFWKMLPRSIFFILGGVILALGGIYLEMARRRLIRRIRW